MVAGDAAQIFVEDQAGFHKFRRIFIRGSLKTRFALVGQGTAPRHHVGHHVGQVPLVRQGKHIGHGHLIPQRLWIANPLSQPGLAKPIARTSQQRRITCEFRQACGRWQLRGQRMAALAVASRDQFAADSQQSASLNAGHRQRIVPQNRGCQRLCDLPTARPEKSHVRLPVRPRQQTHLERIRTGLECHHASLHGLLLWSIYPQHFLPVHGDCQIAQHFRAQRDLFRQFDVHDPRPDRGVRARRQEGSRWIPRLCLQGHQPCDACIRFSRATLLSLETHARVPD